MLPDVGAVRPVQFQQFGDHAERDAGANIDLLLDVNLRVTVELGRTSMTIKEILELGPGAVVELDKLAGEPVDILVNDKPIAKGEVVVVDENFGVRVTDIVSRSPPRCWPCRLRLPPPTHRRRRRAAAFTCATTRSSPRARLSSPGTA
jgi:flagellar motor switch protein FliN